MILYDEVFFYIMQTFFISESSQMHRHNRVTEMPNLSMIRINNEFHQSSIYFSQTFITALNPCNM